MQPQVYKYTQTDVLVTFIEQGFFFYTLGGNRYLQSP